MPLWFSYKKSVAKFDECWLVKSVGIKNKTCYLKKIKYFLMYSMENASQLHSSSSVANNL